MLWWLPNNKNYKNEISFTSSHFDWLHISLVIYNPTSCFQSNSTKFDNNSKHYVNKWSIFTQQNRKRNPLFWHHFQHFQLILTQQFYTLLLLSSKLTTETEMELKLLTYFLQARVCAGSKMIISPGLHNAVFSHFWGLLSINRLETDSHSRLFCNLSPNGPQIYHINLTIWQFYRVAISFEFM